MTAGIVQLALGEPAELVCAICGESRRGVALHTFTPAGNRRAGVPACWRCLAGAIDVALDVNIVNQVDQWLWMRENASGVRAGERRTYERPKPRRKDTSKRKTKRQSIPATMTGDE
ncbi:MAG: hypothetical protein O2816_05075 [Planctomycetota bacterium]|nr:hypothetical protein [Planctomycetota bacterium]